MDLSLSETQQAIRQAFSSILEVHSGPDQVRAAEQTGFDSRLWRRLVDVGLPSMGLPAPHGDAATLEDMVVVVRECGRHLASVPFVESVVAARLLASVHAGEFLVEVAEGERLPTIILEGLPSDATQALVPAGAVAHIVLALRGEQLIGIIPGERVAVQNFGSQPIATIDLEAAREVTVLAEGTEAALAHAKAVDEWRVLTAAALDGLRDRALKIGVDYVKNRKAFGVAIGSFQAVQHRLADLSVAGDGAELLVYEAAWAADNGLPNAPALAGYALSFASRTAFLTCREAVQFHGGYGVTLEYDIQLYFRRAKAWPLAIGDLVRQEQRVAQLVFSGKVG